ncbi:MAG: tetratricopeptide repeat protein [Chloroflexi bacterium]|nr:tetratricopeptide repeat protein [Chloroflexota bacterium]
MLKKRRRSNPWRVIVLILLVSGALYINQVVVPATPPLFIPTPTPTRSPESYVADAENMLAEGRISPAIDAYYEAIRADPRNASNYIVLSRLLIYSAKYDEAIENAANALLINPNNSMALALQGWAMGFRGEFFDAETVLKKAITADPNNYAAYAYLAEVYALQVQAGEDDLTTLDNAVEASRTAMDLNQNALETLRARGVVLELTGNYEEAAVQFEAAINQNPNIADLHLALGRNYRYLTLYDKAVEEFNRANALNPSDPLPDTYISRTYLTVGEISKAIQYAEQALKDDPTDPYMYGNLGTMYYRNEQYNEAIKYFRIGIQGGLSEDGQVVEGLPLDAGRISEYYQLFGLSLARNAACGDAIQIAQILKEGQPDDEYAVYNADEMINICQGFVDNPPTPSPTILFLPSSTPQP